MNFNSFNIVLHPDLCASRHGLIAKLGTIPIPSGGRGVIAIVAGKHLIRTWCGS